MASGAQQDQELQFKYSQLEATTALELARIEATTQTEQNANFEKNKESTGGN